MSDELEVPNSINNDNDATIKDTNINNIIDNKNIEPQNSNQITKNESKKTILPSIKTKSRKYSVPPSAYTSILKECKSQKNLDDYFTSKNDPNSKKDKLITMKHSLNTLIKKINDLEILYKKLSSEIIENKSLLKHAFKSSQFIANITSPHEESIKFEDGEEDDKKENVNNNNDMGIKEESEQNNDQEDNEDNDNINNDNINENQQTQKQQPKTNHSIETRFENKEDPIIHMNKNNDNINNQINNYNFTSDQNNIQGIQENEEGNSNNFASKKNFKSNSIETRDSNFDSKLFEGSGIPSGVFKSLLVKTELSSLRHKMISIQENILIKEEEINEVFDKSKMKNILLESNKLLFQSNELQKIQTRTNELETFLIPNKTKLLDNLKDEFDYYDNIKKKVTDELNSYKEKYSSLKILNDTKNKSNKFLLEKSESLKYQYKKYKQNGLKKDIEVTKNKQKISEISNKNEEFNKFQEKSEKNETVINNLKEELNLKTNDFNEIDKERNKNYVEIEEYERQTNIRLNREKNLITEERNNIRDFEKLINQEMRNYSEINMRGDEGLINLYSKKSKGDGGLLEFIDEEKKNYDKMSEEYKTKIVKEKSKYSVIKLKGYNYLSKIVPQNKEIDNQKNIQNNDDKQ